LQEAAGAFGQDLEAVLGGAGHDVENFLDEIEGDIFMKEVAHGVDEDGARLFPAEGDIESLGLEGQAEAVAVVGLAHGAEAAGESFGVAVLAAGADFGAAGDGVPG